MRALVTGANRGIGAALAAELAARGHAVTGTSRDGSAGLRLDVCCDDDLAALATSHADASLDLLVCNAGVYLDRGTRAGSPAPAQAWYDTFDTNVIGVYRTIEATLPALTRAKGRIAIISSQMGSSERARGGSYAYRASKAAALNLGRNLAVDLRGEGIAVGIYHPGWVQTDMGSPAADIPVSQSATGLADRIEALSLATTGCFEFWNGEPCPF